MFLLAIAGAVFALGVGLALPWGIGCGHFYMVHTWASRFACHVSLGRPNDHYLLYFNTGFLRPMVKDSRNPGACGVLLLPWVVPLWSLDGPERFLLFQICAFTVYFCKRVWLPMAMTSVCSQSRSHQWHMSAATRYDTMYFIQCCTTVSMKLYNVALPLFQLCL